nr:hypothetical protein [Alkalisalibacterium limincola]
MKRMAVARRVGVGPALLRAAAPLRNHHSGVSPARPSAGGTCSGAEGVAGAEGALAHPPAHSTSNIKA